MKLSILLLFLTSTIVGAEEPKSHTAGSQAPPRPAGTSAAQQFEEVDIILAVAHYKRLMEKANEVRLKLALKKVGERLAAGDATPDPKQTDNRQSGLQKIQAEHKLQAEANVFTEEIRFLEDMAYQWRSEAVARANQSASTK